MLHSGNSQLKQRRWIECSQSCGRQVAAAGGSVPDVTCLERVAKVKLKLAVGPLARD